MRTPLGNMKTVVSLLSFSARERRNCSVFYYSIAT
jgi:hypothetical protein